MATICEICGCKVDGRRFYCGGSLRCKKCWHEELIEIKANQLEILASEIKSLKEKIEDKAL